MSISKAEHDELCCVYSALLLHDDGLEITTDKLNKVISASGNKVEAYYPEFFAKYFKSIDLGKLLQSVAAPTAATGGAPVEAVEEKKDDKKGGKDAKGKDAKGKAAPKKKEVKEDSDSGSGGFGMGMM